jgi:hypothetical protein
VISLEIFVLGLIFGLVIQPLLDGFASLILSFFEMIKSYFAVVISKNNKRMTDEEKTTIRKIGFVTEEEIEDDDL